MGVAGRVYRWRHIFSSYADTVRRQVGTTKGTGGNLIILEEAAYCDPGFFYETVAPLMIVSDTTLIGISTLTSEINFYTRLIRLKDKATGASLFTVMQVELACAKCKDEGKATECVHLLHLVPRWQSSERHRRLKTVMQDRPDLIESELSGLAFDSLQQCFRPADIEVCVVGCAVLYHPCLASSARSAGVSPCRLAREAPAADNFVFISY